MKQKCKQGRHRWRVGSYVGGLKGKRIVKVALNIWCEKCGKTIKAYYNSKLIFPLIYPIMRRKA